MDNSKYEGVLINKKKLLIKIGNNSNKNIQIYAKSVMKVFKLNGTEIEKQIVFLIDKKEEDLDKDELIIQVDKLKKEADALIKSDMNETIAKYDNVLFILAESEKKFNVFSLEKRRKLLEYEKFLLSNKSLVLTKLKRFNEAVELCEFIIERIDAKFDKAYARLIDIYLIIDDVNKAEYYANEMKRLFDKDVYEGKYGNIMKRLRDKIKQQQQVLKRFAKSRKVNQPLYEDKKI